MIRLVVAALLLSAALPAVAAPPVRPLAGSGILIMNSLPAGARLPLYERPGVRRVAELEPGKLPVLVPGRTAAAVTLRKGEWARVVYDENGREGWLRMERSWRHFPWSDYLRGRLVSLPPGTKPQSDLPIAAGEQVRVSAVEDDRLRGTAAGRSFRIRWRDDNGRILVVPERD
jgi:hypothetical protein